ncbi:MAG: hypothetical protein UZ16_OP3001000315 [Candidatus Hinthialibacteria bacterium OLB16]|nr:MAG: hypothetical protein UZ16_OP3001000315 [Candidatus Hinthialibacteria bacterium OLB16]MBK7497188.1 PilZ domain-containing protein [Candidatus Omnitrophota bacterium]NUP92675.1 PilZ domain-containing protein [Candidatus Omnitrophota bacterium]
MLIKPGTRVKIEIRFGEQPIILYSLVRMCDAQRIEIDAPTVKGKRAAVPVETPIVLVESSREGLLIIESHVQEVLTRPLPVWLIPIPRLEMIRRIQRRREERYLVDLHLRWKRREDREYRKDLMHIIDINSQGAFATLPESMELESEFFLDLTPLVQIGGRSISQRVSPVCKVVRKASGPGEGYGITFTGMEREIKTLLNEAIRRLKSKVV